MNKINTFESILAVVKNALGTPATRKPSIPKDREPRLYQTSRKNNPFSYDGVQKKSKADDNELYRLKLCKSMIMMLGSFLERAPESKAWKRSELRNFISHIGICLEIKPGKLNLQQYANVVIRLDEIALFKDGELTGDLEAIEEIVRNYGEKLAQQHEKI